MNKRQSTLPERARQIARLLPFLAMGPVLWTAGRIGLRVPAMRMMSKRMQSPRMKRQAFAGYTPTAHDVIVCTYAKSGTNWMMQIVEQIAYRGRADFEHIHDLVPWPDAPMFDGLSLDDPSGAEHSPTGLRAVKTHLDADFVPYNTDAKYVVVLRDPKDVLVSSHFFAYETIGRITGVPPVDKWVEMFLDNQFPFGPWPEHVASYWRWRERPNVLIVSFGEMKANLDDVVSRVAALMGVALSPEEHAAVVERSGFAYMKAHETQFAPPTPFGGINTNGTMIRQGKRGGSSELLTVEQQRQIDEMMQSSLSRLAPDFPYDKLFEVVEPAVANSSTAKPVEVAVTAPG